MKLTNVCNVNPAIPNHFCLECNLYFCSCKKSCDLFCFFSVVCTIGPIGFLVLWGWLLIISLIGVFCLSGVVYVRAWTRERTGLKHEIRLKNSKREKEEKMKGL
jgi:hypothetical protein